MISAFGIDHGDYEIEKLLKPIGPSALIGAAKAAKPGAMAGRGMKQMGGGLKAMGGGAKQIGRAGGRAFGGLSAPAKVGVGGGTAAALGGGGIAANRKRGMSGLGQQ